MCHARPQDHPCGHSSVKWSYCPAARIDLSTGQETPCKRTTYTTAQTNDSTCSLRTCWFGRHASDAWICCACGQGPNTKGWCTFATQAPRWEQNYMTGEYEVVVDCGHGCCQNCVPYDMDDEEGGEEESVDEETETERRREKSQTASSKKHSSRGKTSSGRSDKKKSGSSADDGRKGASYDVQLDYASKKSHKGKGKDHGHSKKR